MSTVICLLIILLGFSSNQNSDQNEVKLGGCADPIAMFDPSYENGSQLIFIYQSPSIKSGTVGQIFVEAYGALCYVRGERVHDSDKWLKICMDVGCCYLGYVPMQQMRCSSQGVCKLNRCYVDGEPRVVV